MKKILYKVTVFIILFGVFANTTLAGNTSYSITVSCTIPAIPGINVPLLEEETVTTGPQIASAMQEGALQESQEQSLEKEQLATLQDGTLMITKTFYSR